VLDVGGEEVTEDEHLEALITEVQEALAGCEGQDGTLTIATGVVGDEAEEAAGDAGADVDGSSISFTIEAGAIDKWHHFIEVFYKAFKPSEAELVGADGEAGDAEEKVEEEEVVEEVIEEPVVEETEVVETVDAAPAEE
jgi:hypothetical protein